MVVGVFIMRPLFKFYKSYYDVMNELPEKNQLEFLKAIFEKQFFNHEPKLIGIVKLAYVSQRHSIEASVKGFIDKTGVTLENIELNDPTQGGIVAPTIDPTVQLEMKLKLKKKIELKNELFDLFYSNYGKKVQKEKAEIAFNKLTEKEKQLACEKSIEWVKAFVTDVKFQPHPTSWLNGKRFNDEIQSAKSPAEKKFKCIFINHLGKYDKIYTEKEYNIMIAKGGTPNQTIEI